jgi:hypothetical protein
VPAGALETFLIAAAPNVDRDRSLTLIYPESGLEVRLPARFLLELLACWKAAPSRWP